MKNNLLFLVLLLSQIMMGQLQFEPVAQKQLDAWLAGAKKAAEVNVNAVPNLHDNHSRAMKHTDDSNSMFNYGLSLTSALQPGLASASERPLSPEGHQIAKEAEKAYKAAIGLYEKHGRANIMLGLLYNQLGTYLFSEKYLEVGLQLEEGGKDWMVAANQYLLAGAYTYSTGKDTYQEIYKKFKVYARQKDIASGPYYLKMAVLYVSYYEN